ncbi:MAG: alcohol dehydrogenase catalytic domain-containing protein [Eubacteriales bacterium]|nr:alcohol dehydrogenase catalytic domain-containing protein [Eubacteriales bacterium]
MKAYMMAEPFVMKSVGKEIPQPGPGEVLVRIKNIGICGSDIHLFKGSYSGPSKYPTMFGHEWSGIVEKIGEGVTKVKKGDKVTGDCSKFCGHCDMCERDKNLCRNIEKYGITVDGASAEYVVRPEEHLYKAPDSSDLGLLSMAEPIAVARHLIEKVIKVSPKGIQESKILIYGAGAIGLSLLMLLKHEYGCETVSQFDLIEKRLEAAKKLGGSIEEPSNLIWKYGDEYSEMYNNTPYDVIFETTGVASIFSNSLKLLRPEGILGCVGMIPNVEIPQKLVVTKALAIVGSIGGTGEFNEVIDFINSHKNLVRIIMSHKFNAEDIKEAFETASDSSKSIKVVLEL